MCLHMKEVANGQEKVYWTYKLRIQADIEILSYTALKILSVAFHSGQSLLIFVPT